MTNLREYMSRYRLDYKGSASVKSKSIKYTDADSNGTAPQLSDPASGKSSPLQVQYDQHESTLDSWADTEATVRVRLISCKFLGCAIEAKDEPFLLLPTTVLYCVRHIEMITLISQDFGFCGLREMRAAETTYI